MNPAVLADGFDDLRLGVDVARNGKIKVIVALGMFAIGKEPVVGLILLGYRPFFLSAPIGREEISAREEYAFLLAEKRERDKVIVQKGNRILVSVILDDFLLLIVRKTIHQVRFCAGAGVTVICSEIEMDHACSAIFSNGVSGSSMASAFSMMTLCIGKS